MVAKGLAEENSVIDHGDQASIYIYKICGALLYIQISIKLSMVT